MKANRYCIIMAGGQGNGFWPLSRISRPKEILNYLVLEKTLIRQTYERFIKIIPEENILIVSTEEYKEVLKQQIPEIKEQQILIEPYSRNTSPCISYATYYLLNKNPDAIMLVSPADHIISDESLFYESIEEAFEYAENNEVLMTIGVEPTRVDVSYGYIQVNGREGKYLKVKTFTEKPNEDLAKIFYESGEFYWNTGIYIWKASLIKEEIEKYIPEIKSLFQGWEENIGTKNEKKFLEKAYSDCPYLSIDYGVMEKTSKACLYPAKFRWTDIGSWESLANNIKNTDEWNNALCVENSILSECTNTLFLSKQKDKLIVAKGLENYLVIDTEDALLIFPKESKDFREILSILTQNKYKKYR